VGTTLASREDSIVNALLQVLTGFTLFLEEDQTSTGTTEGLMATFNHQPSTKSTQRIFSNSRSSRNNITVLEGVVQLGSSNQSTSVGNISHQVSTVLISDLAEGGIVPVAGVSRGTADDQTGLEDAGLLGEGFVIDELVGGVKTVGKRLKVDGRGGHLLLGGLLLIVSKVVQEYIKGRIYIETVR